MRISIKLVTLGLLATLGIATLTVAPAYAASCTNAADCITDGVNKAGGTKKTTSLGDIIQTIVDVLLFVLGAVAVIMIVIGGIRYTISQGDSTAVTAAKNTILYAVIGLVVALLAYAIVHFVVAQFVK
jgi:hypothetical protein